MNKENGGAFYFLRKLFQHKPSFIEEEAARMTGRFEKNNYSRRGTAFLGHVRFAEASRAEREAVFGK